MTPGRVGYVRRTGNLIARLLVLCWAVVWTADPGQTAATAEQPTEVDAAAEKPEQLRQDIEFLASEQLRGRSVADETIDQAAEYVAGRMSLIGLRTDSVDGAPFQRLNVSLGSRPGAAENNRVIIERDEGEPITASLARGMNPLAIGSGSGRVSGRLVFAGYGITAPKLNYDDYQGIDVRGAIAIVLRKEPGVSDPGSRFDGTRNTRHAFFATKIDNAIAQGAAAVILVNDPASVLDSVRNERSKIDGERKRKDALAEQLEKLPAEAVNSRQTLGETIRGIDAMLSSLQDRLAQAQRGLLEIDEAGERPAGKDTIPVVCLARDLVSELLQQSGGRSLEQLEAAIDQSSSPQSFELPGLRATLEIELQPSLAPTSNVIGVLDGRGELADETLVVGAHYDHVGMGGFGSLAPGTIAVHNGADDNASGTAAMLAIAGQLVPRLGVAASHRRLVFIAFTGEERGLVGSKHYVRSPRFPLESTVAMINLDMVGRLRDNELTVYGTGSADGFEDLVESANTRQQFSLFKVSTGYGPSDHQSFYEAGVPVLFFFTGLHNDYHRPSDDFDKIDFGGLVRVTDIVSEVSYQLAIRSERPKYAATENRVQIRRQMTAFLGVTLSDRGDHVVLSGLAAGGPAERGGLQVGDRLEKLADRRVGSSAEVLDVIRSRSPGDELKVLVWRQQRPVELLIRLQPRPGG